ncbi:hypothetical protein EJ02DRAFT_260446 [Clathrospora elynae]|uniref:Uncharacterized protein n=1 Tax=Clathrospora elynae TaxID=706981 RepID=A0A6A5T2X2_9PLEO|nr:hypothetical protein EJ02DRAFT_260446 [Clathrospora elynae]
MPVKAGDLMATAPGQVATMISDGKRMRVLWVKGNGNGNPNKSLIDRCLNTVKGHPTWKLFCGDVSNPIIRGQNEPPHYVYLDDRACFLLCSSPAYSKQELKAFWSFDFDAQGNIRTNRANRGRPAYVDDLCIEYGKGPLRFKSKMYVFSGAPVLLEAYAPAGATNEVKSEQDNAGETVPSTQANTSESILGNPETKASKAIQATPTTLSTGGPLTPNGTPLGNTEGTYPFRPKWSQANPLSNARILYEHTTPTNYVSGPIDGTLKPLGLAHKAIQGSPYFDVPCAAFRKRPRSISGDLAAKFRSFGSKGTVANVSPLGGLAAVRSAPMKRNFITEAFGMPGPKKVKNEEQSGDEVLPSKASPAE